MPNGHRSIREARFYHYACTESRVGRLLVVMTPRGVVDVVVGDDPRRMLSTALARHPGAGFVPDKGRHAEWVAAVVRRIEQPHHGVAVPLDLRAPFEREGRAAS